MDKKEITVKMNLDTYKLLKMYCKKNAMIMKHIFDRAVNEYLNKHK